MLALWRFSIPKSTRHVRHEHQKRRFPMALRGTRCRSSVFDKGKGPRRPCRQKCQTCAKAKIDAAPQPPIETHGNTMKIFENTWKTYTWIHRLLRNSPFVQESRHLRRWPQKQGGKKTEGEKKKKKKGLPSNGKQWTDVQKLFFLLFLRETKNHTGRKKKAFRFGKTALVTPHSATYSGFSVS